MLWRSARSYGEAWRALRTRRDGRGTRASMTLARAPGSHRRAARGQARAAEAAAALHAERDAAAAGAAERDAVWRAELDAARARAQALDAALQAAERRAAAADVAEAAAAAARGEAADERAACAALRRVRPPCPCPARRRRCGATFVSWLCCTFTVLHKYRCGRAWCRRAPIRRRIVVCCTRSLYFVPHSPALAEHSPSSMCALHAEGLAVGAWSEHSWLLRAAGAGGGGGGGRRGARGRRRSHGRGRRGRERPSGAAARRAGRRGAPAGPN